MYSNKHSEERGKKLSDVLVVEIHTSAAGKLKKSQNVNVKVIEFSGDTHDVTFAKGTPFDDGSVNRHVHELSSDIAHADMAAIEISFPDATPNKKKIRRWHVDHVTVIAVSRVTGFRRRWLFPVYSWLELQHCVFFEATPRLPCDTPGKVSELRAAEIDRNMHLYPYDAYHSKLPAAAIAPAGSAPASSSTSTTTTSSVAATTAPPLPGPMQYQARSLPAHFGGAYADLPSDEQWTNPSMRITDWHAAKKKQMHELGVITDKTYKKWRDDGSRWTSFTELNDFMRSVPHTHQQTFWKSDVELGRQLLEGVHPTRIELVTEQYLVDHSYVQLSIVPERSLEGMTVWNAMTDGRIFIVNYTLLAREKFQVPMEDSQKNFMAAPLCMLFVRPSDGELVPVAIQLKKHGIVFTAPARVKVAVTAEEKAEERAREEQDAERREAVNKAQEKLMEVGREVEDAAKESEREIDEIKRQAWHDIEMKRQKFQLMEQEHLARVKAMSEAASPEEKAAMDEAVASLSAPSPSPSMARRGGETARLGDKAPASSNRLEPQQRYEEAKNLTLTDWLLAKAFFLNADAIFHQVVSTYLLTHACLEPYVIAMRRNMSSMHPIHKLLAPHFRGVLATNSVARESLVGPEGVLSSMLPPGVRTLELARYYYANNGYQLHQQSFPAQLAKRGVGVSGKLKEYRWRSDGQMLWDAIVDYVDDFLDLYYKDSASVQEDEELRAWYREVVEVGHEGCAFKPMLSQGNVKTTVATIIFNASCQHASLTSGDFAYNSYPVARPFIMHGDPDKLLDEKRSAASRSLSGEIESDKFFRYMPTKVDSVKQLALSSLEVNAPFRHDFLRQDTWREMWLLDEDSRFVFARFQHRLKEIEKAIDLANHQRTLGHVATSTWSPSDHTVTKTQSRNVAGDTTTVVTTSTLIGGSKQSGSVQNAVPRVPYVALAPSSVTASLTA